MGQSRRSRLPLPLPASPSGASPSRWPIARHYRHSRTRRRTRRCSLDWRHTQLLLQLQTAACPRLQLVVAMLLPHTRSRRQLCPMPLLQLQRGRKSANLSLSIRRLLCLVLPRQHRCCPRLVLLLGLLPLGRSLRPQLRPWLPPHPQLARRARGRRRLWNLRLRCAVASWRACLGLAAVRRQRLCCEHWCLQFEKCDVQRRSRGGMSEYGACAIGLSAVFCHFQSFNSLSPLLTASCPQAIRFL